MGDKGKVKIYTEGGLGHKTHVTVDDVPLHCEHVRIEIDAKGHPVAVLRVPYPDVEWYPDNLLDEEPEPAQQVCGQRHPDGQTTCVGTPHITPHTGSGLLHVDANGRTWS